MVEFDRDLERKVVDLDLEGVLVFERVSDLEGDLDRERPRAGNRGACCCASVSLPARDSAIFCNRRFDLLQASNDVLSVPTKVVGVGASAGSCLLLDLDFLRTTNASNMTRPCAFLLYSPYTMFFDDLLLLELLRER